MGFENVECRAVIAPSAGHPQYDSWDALLASPDGAAADSNEIVVGRGTYLCHRLPAAPEGQAMLEEYWYGTHQDDHSRKRSARLRELYGFAALDESITRAFSTAPPKPTKTPSE